MRIPPARTVPIRDGAADELLIGGASLLTYYNVTESTASGTARVRLWDGTGTDGALIASITLTANESTRDLIPPPGLLVRTGLFLEVVAGAVEGAVWVVPEELMLPYTLTQGANQFWGGEE